MSDLDHINDFLSGYDRDGDLIDAKRMLELRADPDYLVVANDYVGDARISTVWLGLNHNRSGVGDPVIFETMVFAGESHPWADFTLRYTTEEDAQYGHQLVYAAMLKNTKPEKFRTPDVA